MKYDSTESIDIQSSTYTALKNRFQDLARVIDVLGAERQALADEINKREREAAARIRLGSLSEDGKRVYRRVLET